ncbi:hypothetical protein JEZ13_05825 [bacterium]|nr:hypothetical protein [bacterium]
MKMKLIMLMCIYIFFTNLLCNDMESIMESGNKKKQIAGYIQMLSPIRFGNDLKRGDRVVYCYKTEGNNESIHSLEVYSKDDKNMVILEEFEGNAVYIRLDNKTKEVTEIWGTDEFGENQTIDVLSKNELSTFENEINDMFATADSFLQISGSFYLEAQTVKKQVGLNSRITTIDVKMDFAKTNIPVELSEEVAKDNELILSSDVPKMLPLIPVALSNFNKSSILKQYDYGFVENNVLELRSFKK